MTFTYLLIIQLCGFTASHRLKRMKYIYVLELNFKIMSTIYCSQVYASFLLVYDFSCYLVQISNYRYKCALLCSTWPLHYCFANMMDGLGNVFVLLLVLVPNWSIPCWSIYFALHALSGVISKVVI
jgi:hypothetical protein